MRLFSWFNRVPARDAPIPENARIEVYVTGEDSSEDDHAPEVAIAKSAVETFQLSDLFIYIEYENAGGIKSRRPITIKKEVEKSGNTSLYAYCHETKRLKMFRLDRIDCVITSDGEVFQPASKFWREVGYSTGKNTVRTAIQSDDRYAATDAKRQFRNELVVLAALARADGNVHEREVDEIVDYIEREIEWERQSFREGEILALRNYIRRIRITRDSLDEGLFALLQNIGKERLYARQLERFLKAARSVVDADGHVHNSEYEFIEYLESLAGNT